jgi:hypothetical protein
MNSEQNENTIAKMLQAMNYEEAQIEAALTALRGESAASRVADEPLMSPKQLCRRLEISITSLWRMQPPYIRVGARKRFVWSEVEEFLRQGRVAA